ncbi:2,3-diketo-L-gulonate-binding periplasmic protein YiaO precursor [Aquimixticola soesokkakensis]|uniref:2,3-diketo-L-gulonate-binding periplasmic protein YiaO n=1 Tax=Aquimixticola soesokkakensis TaxID=1519096 RepID=A0A1Y5RZG8_9RHOB|nr:TRAP transporter substrate-binding protein [Aquimixticola soesokkakensis]SLN29171.1 2,3-diketo-L-gulonate-binding periplasmic protein YiaO precursor [Aquimixticola soesokkakensis]
MKKTLLWTSVSLLAFTGAAQALELRFAYAQNATPTVEAMQKFGELVAEKTDGEVTVTYFPDSQLGGERELLEMVQGGLLDITKVSGGLMESFSPVYGVFAMPYLFDGEEHFYAAMDSADVTDPIYGSTREQGMVALTYYNSGARSFYTKDKPIMSVEDLKGLKIRVLQSPTLIEMVELLGGAPIAMSQAEVYTSIQQGVLDGAENNEFAITIARHGEVAKEYSYDMHSRIPDVLMISTATLDKLTDDQRTAIQEAAAESTEFHKSVWGASVDAARAQSQEEFGVNFNYPDVAQFQEAVAPMYEKLKAEPEKYAAYEAIRAHAEQ